ncbi:SET domain-containing protein [Hymenopellis radicata]|nr:SET domain-containing protein [Hymenopellis radicata]
MHCTHQSCKRPDQCDCQPEGETWEIYQKRRVTGEATSKRAFAYDNSKNFSFLFDSKLTSKCVVECNKYCACDLSCPNRVAQRPRQIPIEIFKTKRCGWGARSSVSVNRGNVLGVYTGEVLNREAAKRTKNPGYVFDLDWLDNVDDDDGADELTYSVESFKCGNWTRFMNHSCDPNVGVYMVSYDSLPDMNTPYIAFTALKRIAQARSSLSTISLARRRVL